MEPLSHPNVLQKEPAQLPQRQPKTLENFPYQCKAKTELHMESQEALLQARFELSSIVSFFRLPGK